MAKTSIPRVGEAELILKCVSIEELGNLLRAYQRGVGKPILIGTRDLKRLIVATIGAQSQPGNAVRRVGGDGWLVLSPHPAGESAPSSIDLNGEIGKRPVRGRFDGVRIIVQRGRRRCK